MAAPIAIKLEKINVLHSFVHKMVKNVLYDSMIPQSDAICLGMSHVIITTPFQMLQVFNPNEFQILINGRALSTLDCGLNPPFTVGDFGRDTERWPTIRF
ncbi:hypothetical protein ACOME3_009546 [Neoechinorhynchus agilis]